VGTVATVLSVYKLKQQSLIIEQSKLIAQNEQQHAKHDEQFSNIAKINQGAIKNLTGSSLIAPGNTIHIAEKKQIDQGKKVAITQQQLSKGAEIISNAEAITASDNSSQVSSTNKSLDSSKIGSKSQHEQGYIAAQAVIIDATEKQELSVEKLHNAGQITETMAQAAAAASPAESDINNMMSVPGANANNAMSPLYITNAKNEAVAHNNINEEANMVKSPEQSSGWIENFLAIALVAGLGYYFLSGNNNHHRGGRNEH
jgi:hypothetical protein